ncbi:unnamed protein product, partial [Enterobius vermicularis]|uniref:Ferric-chelate reductase 1 n=1 Tax=Enterobius vermicularis TaxID=51028 RepID=A0A0N4VEK4_ENTVE
CIWTITAFSFKNCGTSKGCWFQPPQCETDHINDCDSSVQWTVLDDGVLFEIEATTLDLDPAEAHYISVGISKDTRMGDDSVVECIFAADGSGRAYISFNDETHNEQLYQASSVMINDTNFAVENGTVRCSVKWQFSARQLVNPKDQFKVFDLESGLWHLLFARGNADVYSLKKRIHSVNDGPLFPWISEQKIHFCGYNCSSDPFVVISTMKQTDLSRYWRYRFAVIHGSFLLLAWWVLGSSAILLARYFKPLWQGQRLLGTAVWFQLHRDLNIVSVVIQAVAVFLIIYQAGRLYECSYACSLEDWNKKMHVINGIGAMGFALIQPFLAFIRPGPNSRYRPIFNWIHWFFGMLAWTLACMSGDFLLISAVAIFLSVSLGKTGLMFNYGHIPTWIMAGYMITFFLCCIVLEILSSVSSRRVEKLASYRFVAGPTGMALSVINGPSVESPIARPTFATARLFIFFVHLVVALGVSITITAMLVKILLAHSP